MKPGRLITTGAAAPEFSGGNTLYGGPGAGNWDYTNRAYKVSYNRPFDTRSFEAASWVFGNEYPMVRWLEANGYDVTYFTHVDGVRNSSLITNHKDLHVHRP